MTLTPEQEKDFANIDLLASSGDWQGEDDYFETITRIRRDLEEAQREIARLSELLWGSRCVYCGEVLGREKQNQEIADEDLRAHVETCPKHPVAALKKALEEAQAKLAEMESQQYDLACRMKESDD